MADPSVTANIGSLTALPDGEFEATDLFEVERPRADPDPNDNYRATFSELTAAVAAALPPSDAAQTGDILITARNPGAGWLRCGHIYSQSAYPDLFDVVGLVTDGPPGATYVTGSGALGRTVAMYATISDDEIIGVGNNIIWRSHDGGTTWVSETVTLGNLVGVWALPSGIYAVTATAWYRSTDGGATFSAITRPTGNPPAPVQMLESQGRVFAVITSSTPTQYSDDFGFNWTSTGELGRQSVMSFGNGVMMSFANNSTITRRSVDNGVTWTAGATIPYGPLSGSTHYADSTGLGVLAGNGNVVRTTDFGITWSSASVASVRHIIRVGNRLLAVASGAVANAYSDDLGVSWVTATGSSLANPVVIVGKYAVVVTNASGSTPQVSGYTFNYDSGSQFRVPRIEGLQSPLQGYIKA